ncbi:MAG: phosphatase PAP2 family protein [Chlorogloea purpurea SAG 13.99]|nr:phosphatase PAP2 family protein [Chlorogloea purpurea SAG 13.99]
MLTITRLGDPEIVVVIVAIFLGWLVWKRYFQEAKIFILACLGAFILNTQMKLVFGRIRPELWTRLIKETSYSFPSGHALGSLVLYGIIAYLLSQHYPRWEKLFYCLAVILIGIIGFSRLYLGVHWPTDIIAGYVTGFLWLVICIVMVKLQKIPAGSDKLF